MKHKLLDLDHLNKINEEYFKYYPQHKGLKWAGCNFYINRGNVWSEPIGTATSMHDCEGCDEFSTCNLKKDNPVWIYKTVE